MKKGAKLFIGILAGAAAIFGLSKIARGSSGLPAGKARLYGVVTNAAGEPIRNVSVLPSGPVYVASIGTDRDGVYDYWKFRYPIEPGSYIITFVKTGYQDYVTTLNIVAGDNELNVQMVVV